MRAIHAVRELNEQRAEPIQVIAFYTEPERHALFVRRADERHCLGQATVVDGDGRRSNGYLDYEALERALVETRADAAWVGWGFVAEHPRFAELCRRLGIVFVGPDPDTMRALGDKIEAKRLAEQAGVPVAPWSGGPVESVEDAVRHGEALGLPLIIKAAAGGGGRGMRRVDRAEELPSAYERARAEAAQAFGDPSVLMERLVDSARHVEVQLVADGHGAVWALGVRDCSYQRRHQKVVEESASPALAPEQERELAAAAVRLAKLARYRGVGTVEFLYEPAEQAFSFMEVNTRLQVEHPVTEMVTGADLVKLQLHIAAGGRLEGDPPPPRGHAIEVRLNAEDPGLGFAPAPGRVALLRLPTGPGVRVDSGLAEGDTVPPEFDSMIAKIIAHGPTRADAIARLRRAVADTMVVIEEGATNQGFLLDLLDRPELRAGEVDTGWLDRLQAQGDVQSVHHADTALVQAAIALCDAAKAADRAHFYAFARRGRPQAEAPVSRTVDLRYGGASYRFEVRQIGPATYQVEIDGVRIEADVERVTEHECRVAYGGRSYRTLTALQDADLLVEVNGVPHRISRDEAGLVRSHAPAVVVAIPVSVGDEVRAGDVVAVTESMKMESSLVAPVAGRVRRVLVSANVHVAAGRPLVQIEPLEGEGAGNEGERVRFDAGGPGRGAEPSGLQRLVWLVLGYDLSAAEVRSTVDELLAAPLDLDGERRLLEVYADLRALNRPHASDEPDAPQVLGSPQERFHAFLRSLDAGAEGLPDRFVANLERALGQYGIAGLERTPALEDACYRVFLSQQRAEAARAAVQNLLRRQLECAGELSGMVDDEFRRALDRLEAALAPREPALADLARELRWRLFDQPLIEAAREEAYAAMERHLAALAGEPGRADRDAHMRSLVDCPQPLTPLLTRYAGEAGVAAGRVLVEALTRRHYRIRGLEDVHELVLEGVPFVLASYERGGRRHHVAAAFTEPAGVAAALRALAAHARSVPAGERLLADLCTVRAESAATGDELAAELERLLAEAKLPPAVERVAFTVGTRDDVHVMTFSGAPNAAVAEHRDLRGLHPMTSERLDLWRLKNFTLERLPSAHEIYLFRAIARANARDERLIAVAEVRDLTAVRDEAGRITALPELERMARQALEEMRAVQSRRPSRERLQWNRLLLYAWPAMDFEPDEARPVITRLARLTAGLGMEMVLLRARVPEDGGERDRVLRFFNPAGHGVVMEVGDPPSRPLRPLDEGAQRIVSARRRGTVHPAEIVKILAPERAEAGAPIPAGEFTEHDLDPDGRLVPVDRPAATNRAGVVVGLVRNGTQRYPEGMLRVVLLGDPTRALGSLAEPECRRIIAALDLAEQLGVPCEWFALSAGAKIAMDSGTENMDWVAAALRRIVRFTQAGGEINVVVSGINVGAQPYWNAEATMLMHTKGILVMTPESAMVLTGKEALDYSGGVSAEDNFGIGGYQRIMGPNGQAQYWAPDLTGACEVLLSYYEHAYVAPGERFPRRAPVQDPPDRDVSGSPHWAPDSDLRTVGEIFAEATNPGRKKPFDIRAVMLAVADRDHAPLERWKGMRDAEVAVAWDAHLGGWPVAMLGIESRPLPRFGQVPADGPEQWTSGTLFPQASKKIARAINAASGRRPLVVLANLAGFDGSPESMRRLQLEYGAEIGRAIVNFDGPIAFCVISRFHGGAFVVFSRALNENLETSALEGAHASVIGGAPAAAVVFSREVDVRTRTHEEIAELDERIAGAEGAERQRLRAERDARWAEIRSDKLGELAAEFDAVHSVQRAVSVGSVDRIVPASELRPYLIDAVERGMRRTLEQIAGQGVHRLEPAADVVEPARRRVAG
ncbi:MAG: fused acetyl/propionyl-CoA carboxylase subunit alpha/methylmalonyl-CoA decarboxylase subunit alpha [Actinobacteria bacterium]|nr:MAG: fused acetyl/propionyl-CoA carboxylase subunit alpha/methylmalonyl-CoA decarboxylase subunit alpha [Actinomycetota bacterium]